MLNPSNAPIDYECPICLGNKGIESEATLLHQPDRVFSDDVVTVWVNSFWIKGNEGHVIIVPNQHFESLYNLPTEVGHRVFDVSKQIAGVMKKAYQCDGITLRQNNEPAGDQHAFHYHLHVFPRYENDDFNFQLTKKSYLSDPAERVKYVEKLAVLIK